MKEWMLIGMVMVMGGCVDLHTKQCTDQKNGYSYCKHVVEYHTEPACVGSCPTK